MLTKLLFRLIQHQTQRRPCDKLVDKNYMERWFLIPRNPICNIYAHKFIGSDADTPHDHPWYSVGWVLSGQYLEHTPDGIYPKKAGSITLRSPKHMHWIEIENPVYTLFITGPRLWEWGFQCGERWVHHNAYIQRRGENRLANGCGE